MAPNTRQTGAKAAKTPHGDGGQSRAAGLLTESALDVPFVHIVDVVADAALRQRVRVRRTASASRVRQVWQSASPAGRVPEH